MQTNVSGLANLPNHQLAMTLLMTPDMANFMGNAHGGTILKLLDQVAYACASPIAGGYVVTLSVDQVTIPGADPCRRARYLSRCRQLYRQLFVRDWHQGHRGRHSQSCRPPRQQVLLHHGAVDEAGKPTAVPPFKPSTANEHRRFEEAKLRKALRRELAARHRAMKHPPLL